MYKALYRKYRPKTFEDVVGQSVIIKTLTNALEKNKINHAYLFTGPRGTGKTSVAKILARLINCENLSGIIPCDKCVSCTQILNKQNTDIIEIDAASNNGVDEIREIREKVGLVPSFGKYKIYIIDEVHMLTVAAFNALLKTLEEPPEHIIFILATTEPHKIPETILSRCQRFDFKKISLNEIGVRLKQISEKEKINIDNESIELIAKLSDGGMRDSLSLLDQLDSYCSEKITLEAVNEICGYVTQTEAIEFIELLLKKEIKSIFSLIDKYNSLGKNLIKIMEFIIETLKNILICYNCHDYFENNEIKDRYLKICSITTPENIYNIIEVFMESIKQCKTTNSIKLIFELSVIKIIQLGNNEIFKINDSSSDDIKIYEEKPKLIEVKKEQIPKISDELLKEIEIVKKIRINNSLTYFNKKQLIEFKKNIDDMKTLLLEPEYSSIVSLILDGEVKVKGNEYLILVYNLKGLDEYFNSMLIEIQKLMFKIFNKEYKPIAISTEYWEIIKKEFNDNKKQNKNVYSFMEEIYDLEKIFNKSKKEQLEISDNEIDQIFDEIVIYK